MIYTNDMISKKNKNRKKIKKIIKFIYIPILISLIVLVCYIGYFRFIKKENNISIFGFKQYIVMTGSMEPNYNRGDLVIVKKIPQSEIKLNDIITYSLENGKDTITHRVIDITEENGKVLYKTKGDNNNSPDTELVSYDKVQGKLVYKVNKLGEIIMEFITGIGSIILILIFIIGYIHTNVKEERRIAREDARKRYNVPRYN